MKNGKIRRFRPRSNKHYSGRRNNGIIKNNGLHNSENHRNNFIRTNIKNPHSLERIIEKYKNLAKEALGLGDKILHENYLQHSDHFSRILTEMNQRTGETSQTAKPETSKLPE